MAASKHLDILEKGVEAWNRWREENPTARPHLVKAVLPGSVLSEALLLDANLSGANLAGAELAGAHLSGASLSRSFLSGADIRGARLRGTDLRDATLIGANLSGAELLGSALARANLRSANLESADLRGADLTNANLSGANLSGANLRDARFLGTILHQLSLNQAEGLELANHAGPSLVSSQTLEMSQGRIPDKFLKGCGFPDWAIESAKLFNPNLRQDEIIDHTYKIAEIRGSSPIVPLSVFVAYSHEDSAFAVRIEQRLDSDGIRSWRDAHDLVAGPTEAQFDRAISAQGAVLLVLSEASVESDWVQWEAERARKAAKEKQTHLLCPVALDGAWKKCDWPGKLRSQIQRYLVLDFSDWEREEKFEPQYQKLKKGLGVFYRG